MRARVTLVLVSIVGLLLAALVGGPSAQLLAALLMIAVWLVFCCWLVQQPVEGGRARFEPGDFPARAACRETALGDALRRREVQIIERWMAARRSRRSTLEKVA